MKINIKIFYKLVVSFLLVISRHVQSSQTNNNHVHNILRLFDGWANYCFNKSETKRDY